MIELSDGATKSRVRLAGALVDLIEADPRVRRCRRPDLEDDGGALVVVELHPGPDAIAGKVIARELEFVAAQALPKLAWVRVQVG
jgi:hypothetical protein